MKNNFITKIIGATLAFAMMVGAAAGLNTVKQAKEVNADAASYSIVFQNASGSATAISSTTQAATVIASSSRQYVTSRPFTINSGNCYYGDNQSSIRIGKSGAAASLAVALSTSYDYANAEKEYSLIVVNCEKMTGSKNANAKLSVNGSNYVATPASGSPNNLEFELSTTAINSITLASDAAVFIHSVTLTEKSGDPSSTIESVTASIKDGEYYVGDKLSESDFNVTASWTGNKEDTHPTSGFTWTVNGDANGTLQQGNNSVVVTYQEVSSNPFNVVGIIEPGTQQNNPLSVAAAVSKGNQLTAGNETTKTYYIQGIVSEIVTNQLANDSYATFWLQNGETAHGFEAYQITAADGCSNFNDLRVGAEVLLKCKIFRYNASTIETGSEKSLLSISFTAPTLSSITLNKTSLKLEAGKYETLTVSPNPIGAELGDVTWESSNTDVATVDGNGKVTGVSAGSATITATAGGFTATCDVLVELCAELDLTTDTTTSASADLLTWEVSNKFALQAAKEDASTAANNYYPGTTGKNYTSTRFYKDSVVTLTPDKDLIGVRAEFKATSNSYAKAFKNSTFNNATATLPDGDTAVIVTVTFTDGMKPFSVTIGGTCGFDSVKLFYTEKTAAQKVETNLTTNTELSYRYTKDGNVYTFTDINMRFGGYMSKDLWNELNTNENLIAGVGVMITGYAVQLRSAYSVKDHANEAVSSTGEFNIKTQLVDYYAALTSFSPAEQNNNYYWNLRYSIASQDDIMDEYTAAAYIKLTNGNLVFFKQVTYSVWSLAYDYLTERNCDENTAGGSLYHLFNDAGME